MKKRKPETTGLFRHPASHQLFWGDKLRGDGPISIDQWGNEEYILNERLGVYINLFNEGSIKYSFGKNSGHQFDEWLNMGTIQKIVEENIPF